MIIVSQDKKVIINFDNVENIDIIADLDGTGEIPYNINYETSSKREELGRYKTEERAKEVLQEIVSKYKTTLYNSKTNETVVNVPKVYEMPTK